MTDELPRGWAVAKLGQLVSPAGLMTDGDWVESKDQDPSGDVRLLQLADIGAGEFRDRSNRFLTSSRARDLNCTFLQPGDVLIARLGDVLGKACLAPKLPQPSVTVVDVHVFRSGHADLSHRWLMHLFNAQATQRTLEELSSGTTRKRVTGQRLKDLEVRVPPAKEQQRIVSRIEELFSEIDDGERALARVGRLVERYRQSVLKAAVTGELSTTGIEQTAAERMRQVADARRALAEAEGAKGRKVESVPLAANLDLAVLPAGWSWASIDEIGLVSGGLTKNRARGERELLRPFLRVANVYANRLSLEDVHQIGVSEAELPRVTLKKDDLLIVEGNGSVDQIGRVALWDGSVPDCVHQNHLIKVRCVAAVPAWFVLVWLLSPLGRQHIERVASSSSGLHTLSISKIQSLPVPVPPQAALQRIREEFERMDIAVSGLRQSLLSEQRRAKALRQSVLKAAFSGQLVPQDPSDEPAAALLARIASQTAQAAAPAVTRRRGRKQAA